MVKKKWPDKPKMAIKKIADKMAKSPALVSRIFGGSHDGISKAAIISALKSAQEVAEEEREIWERFSTDCKQLLDQYEGE